jgi:hypothetical protein
MKPLVALLCASWSLGAAEVQLSSRDLACAFSVTGSPTVATVVGPSEVTSRTEIIHQPDSPIEIVAADFRGMRLTVAEGGSGNAFTFEQVAAIEVRNRSNQGVEGVDLRVKVGGCQGTSGLSRWTGSVLPGETTRIRTAGGGGSGSSNSSPIRVWVWIDRVNFKECIYKPAQVIARASCTSSGNR